MAHSTGSSVHATVPDPSSTPEPGIGSGRKVAGLFDGLHPWNGSVGGKNGVYKLTLSG